MNISDNSVLIEFCAAWKDHYKAECVESWGCELCREVSKVQGPKRRQIPSFLDMWTNSTCYSDWTYQERSDQWGSNWLKPKELHKVSALEDPESNVQMSIWPLSISLSSTLHLCNFGFDTWECGGSYPWTPLLLDNITYVQALCNCNAYENLIWCKEIEDCPSC